MVISPYKEFGEMIKEISANFTYEPLIIDGECLDDNFINHLYNLSHNHFNPDVIIGRGAVTTLANKIFKNSSIVRIEPNFIDILYALKKAREYGDKVGILTYPQQEIEENISILENILNFNEIRIYLFHDLDDINRQIANAKCDGMNSIIGGGTAGLEVAKSINIPATFIKTSKEGILNAIEQSISIIESRQKDRELLDNIFSIINCMNEGLLATKKNKVVLSNSKLDDITNISVSNYYYKDIKYINDQIKAFINSEELNKEIIKINEKNYLAEKLISKVSFADNIIIFRSISELQDKEANVRKQLNVRKFAAKYTFKDIIGKDSKILNIINKASIFSRTDAEILITGKTGTGKELFAQSIHNNSTRKDKPFIAVNCGAIPEQLLESELFGYVDGAFSGAKKGGRTGLFELAHKGTIFLDEINSLPITLQGKLLRVIQEKALRRIGSESEIFVDIRIISATNRDIDLLIQKNEFRSDLFHRINTLTINLPNLRERIGDVELLANYFIDAYSRNYNKEIPHLKQNEINILKNHNWTGNIRELENIIHRYIILYDQIEENELSTTFIENYNGTTRRNINDNNTIIVNKDKLEKMEREIIISFLNEYRWNKQEVADKLGISRSTLWRKLKNE